MDAEGDAAILKLVRELAHECPFDHGNPDDCLMHSMRQRPVMERIAALESLPTQALEQIVLRHWRCFLPKLDEIDASPRA